MSHFDHRGRWRCPAYGLVGEAGDVCFPPNCCDVELEQGNKFCVTKSLIFIAIFLLQLVSLIRRNTKSTVNSPISRILLYLVNHVTDLQTVFFYWKLGSLRKFGKQNQFCTLLGSQDVCKTKWDLCYRLMWWNWIFLVFWTIAFFFKAIKIKKMLKLLTRLNNLWILMLN